MPEGIAKTEQITAAQEIDGLIASYEITRSNEITLLANNSQLIDDEQAKMATAEARIRELRQPLAEVHREVHSIVMRSQEVGRELVGREELDTPHRILAGFMVGAASPVEALTATKNTSLLEATIKQEAEVPLLHVPRYSGTPIHIGKATDLMTLFDDRGTKVQINLEDVTQIKNIERRMEVVSEAQQLTVEDGPTAISIQFIDLKENIFAADNLIGRVSDIGPNGVSIGRGLLVGAAAMTEFFTRYATATTNRPYAATTPLDQNQVFQLWSAFKRIGLEPTLPEGLQEAWIEIAKDAIAEPLIHTLDSGKTAAMQDALHELGEEADERTLVSMLYQKREKINNS